MTPAEKEAFHRANLAKQAAARAAFPKAEQDVYHYLKSRWDALGDAFDADKHEKPALEDAAAKFKMTVEQVKDIFIRVDGAGLDV